MWDEDENVYQEGEEGDEYRRYCKDKEGEKVAWGMRGGMEVCGDGEGEADEGEEGSDWMDDEDA